MSSLRIESMKIKGFGTRESIYLIMPDRLALAKILECRCDL
jgi:hypothetical protein